MIHESLSPLWTEGARELCNHTWQSTLFAAIVALLALLLRKNQARARYRLWMAASAKFLIPFSLLVSVGGHLPWPSHVIESKTRTYIAMEMNQAFSDVTKFNGPIISVNARSKSSNHLVPFLPAVLLAVWLCGFAALLAFWCLQLWRIYRVMRLTESLSDGREVRTLRRVEQKLKIGRQTRMLASSYSMEPGIFGIFHPVLLWPVGLSAHLDDAHLQAVLAHEVCHVQRRDNLTSVIHMLVEAIFWFNPLVWWMEHQLVKERERACDEDVLQICDQPRVYVEGILKVCEFCVESPLTCVPGITGADLKKRVVQIMTPATRSRVSLGGRCLLAVVAVMSFVLPMAFGLVRMIPVGAQILHATGPLPSFEVASIRLSPVQLLSPSPNGGTAPNGEQIISQQTFQSEGPARAGPISLPTKCASL